MQYVNFLIQFTENDKRFWFAVLLVIILAFAIIGYIGYLIGRLMKHQGHKLDVLMHDIHITKVVEDPKSFKRVSRKKSYIYFVEKSFIPFGIILIGGIILLIAEVSHNFTYDIFDHTKTGFGTILFVWDFSKIIVPTQGGFLLQWPPVINTPHFEVDAMFSYFIIPLFLVGGIWFIVNICALIARTYRMHILVKELYTDSKLLKPHNDDALLRPYVKKEEETPPQLNNENKETN